MESVNTFVATFNLTAEFLCPVENSGKRYKAIIAWLSSLFGTKTFHLGLQETTPEFVKYFHKSSELVGKLYVCIGDEVILSTPDTTFDGFTTAYITNDDRELKSIKVIQLDNFRRCFFMKYDDFVIANTHLPIRGGGEKRLECIKEIFELIDTDENFFLLMDSNLFPDCPMSAGSIDFINECAKIPFYNESTFCGYFNDKVMPGRNSDFNLPLDIIAVKQEMEVIEAYRVETPMMEDEELRLSDHDIVCLSVNI